MTSRASLVQLPDDLLLLVLQFALDSPIDLRIVTAVSRHMNSMCRKRAAHALLPLRLPSSLLLHVLPPDKRPLVAAMHSLPYITRLVGGPSKQQGYMNSTTLSLILASPSPWTTSLQALLLSNCHELSDRGFYPPHLPTAPLETVAKSVKSMPSLPQLRNLDLSSCHKLTDVTVLRFPALFPNLTALNLSNVYRIKNISLLALAKLPNLTSLDLSGCRDVTDKGLEAIARKLCKLKTLILAGCSRVGDKGVAAIAGGLWFSLKHLNMSHCKELSNSGVAVLGKRGREASSSSSCGGSGMGGGKHRMPSLEMVVLVGCAGIEKRSFPFSDPAFLPRCVFFF